MTPINRFPTTQTTSRIPNLASQVEQLRTKLTGFAVRNNQGGYIGEVRDVQYNPIEQLMILVAIPDPHQQERLVKVNGKLVRQVDASARSLLTHLHPTEIVQLPVWELQSMSSEMNPVKFSSSPLSPQVVEAPEVVEEIVIPLLEERLVVETGRRKVGEVVVRKEVATEMIQVPVRREKLIIEQVGPEPKQLAVVDLNQDNRTPELPPFVQGKKEVTVQAEFASLLMASRVLDAIARQPDSGCQSVQISIVLTDPALVTVYQDWLTHYAQAQ